VVNKEEVKWLTENVFDDLELDNALIKNKYKVTDHDYSSTQSDKEILDLFDADDCVIFHGSIDFAKRLNRIAPWVPGVYCTFDDYACTKYYSSAGSWLLNEEYVMLPFGDLMRQQSFFADIFDTDLVFIRPDASDKPFGGAVVDLFDYYNGIGSLEVNDVPQDALCVVSQSRIIDCEWRLVIVNDGIITGSQYQPTITNDLPDYVVETGYEILSDMEYRPADSAWTMDLCKSHGDILLVEINSFSCAGLYSCDYDKVVKAVSSAALKDWRDYNDI
jgi:hypothetical protein